MSVDYVNIEKMLDIHNKLKGILGTLQECNDLWMSDVKTLEDVIIELRNEFNFKPPMNDEGERVWWSSQWVMETEDEAE